ncbi:phosphate binding protein [Chloroherpeton thalassium ATCC 35110]|uniref:Phosphate-binding protein n=1 Tax=Chloroherpeton thalassium (strain ATCC 35110 / GB-78) TaxID=517418 RepID=B3QVL3_CHLT3|nr:phosphate ABC transporter substrate-binding protein [Chloroherpeton thalassium]ACF14613.1 phosphate binding protein [Chloroherpeton thalassium ATCC 35110]
MSKKITRKISNWLILFVVAFGFVGTVGCSKSSGDEKEASHIITNGSETMKKLAEAWAKEYMEKKSTITIDVLGGGSGTGISSLIHGNADIANASRKMNEEEQGFAEKHFEKLPKEYVVAYDAVAIFVHKDNPLEKISMEELAEIFGNGGSIEQWSQLGIQEKDDDIMVVNRLSNSGTYQTFREMVLGEQGQFRKLTHDVETAEEVVKIVAKNPSAIGYSGIAFDREDVKMLKVSKKRGGEAFDPKVEFSNSSTVSMYPITRPLYLYTIGEPEKTVQRYINWILSKDGQAIVEKEGYVPLTNLDVH